MIKTEKIKGGVTVAIKGDREETGSDIYHIGKAFTTEGLNDDSRRLFMLTMFLDGFEATEDEIKVAMHVAQFANEMLSSEDPEQDSDPEVLS